MAVIRIDRRSVENLPAVARPTTFFDDRLSGFGVRVFPSGVKSWVVEYRPGAGGRKVAKKRLTLGRVSDSFKADAARVRARAELARVVQGADPARERSSLRQAETTAELIEVYLEEHIRPKKKAKTLTSFELLARLHINPDLGSRQAILVEHADVARLHRNIGKRHPTTANRAIELIHAAWAHGVRTRHLPKTLENPATGISKFREERRERLLSAVELASLGQALRLAEGEGLPRRTNPNKNTRHAPRKPVTVDRHAVAAIRLLLFTGARLREILHLRWSEVDLERGQLFLRDSKTGAKAIVLSAPAIEILKGLPASGEFVIPGNEDQPRTDLNRPWRRIREQANLPDLRLHDLRHAFASAGAAANIGLPVIGSLLGHRHAATTARYARLSIDPLRLASDHIATSLAIALSEKAENV